MSWRLISVVFGCVMFCIAVDSLEAAAASQDSASPGAYLSSGVESVMTLAQDDSDGSSGSTRVRTRGVGRLIGLAIAGIIALGSFVMKLFRGQK